MNGDHGIEIICSACGQETVVIREPVYDGFQKTGELLKCASCGHVYSAEEEVPYKVRSEQAVFTDADRSADVDVFEENEAGHLCRYCVHYVVNPFMQWCALHKREVEATDTCDRFEKAEEQANDGQVPLL